MLLGRSDLYIVKVVSHPYYQEPQELCISFKCFSETEQDKHGLVPWIPEEQ